MRLGRSAARIGVRCVAALLFAQAACGEQRADSPGDHAVGVAVASNFATTVERICQAFFAQRAGRCVVTPGASGLLAAQAAQGAPFDIFLSGDSARAGRLEAEGVAVTGTRFTYAIGRLVFWLPGWNGPDDLRAALASGRVRTIAIAKPTSAPYGRAALETLRSLGQEGRYSIVQGENVAQAFQYVASGAADAGFVALSQVLDREAAGNGRVAREVVTVDSALHEPIDQQAVLLAGARDNPDARALLEFMRSDAAQRIIEAAGYAVPSRPTDR